MGQGNSIISNYAPQNEFDDVPDEINEIRYEIPILEPEELHNDPNQIHVPRNSYFEQREGIGTVTTFNIALPKGIIDGEYFFNKTIIHPGVKIELGSKVKFVAVKDDKDSNWECTQINLHFSPEEEAKNAQLRVRTIVGRVEGFSKDMGTALLRFGNPANREEGIQEVPTRLLPVEYLVRIGDYLRVKFQINDLEGIDQGGRILSVEPSNKKILIGKVLKNTTGRTSIDHHIYFDLEVCRGWKPHLGQCVKVTAVESSVEDYNWRAVKIEQSNFPQYTAQQKEEEAWLSPTSSWSGALEDLQRDKNGIQITPRRTIVFSGVKLGSSITQIIQIVNLTSKSIKLLDVIVRGDQSACQFDIEPNSSVIEAKSSISMKITCTPCMLGSTREFCVFEFGSFQIGRFLTVTSLPQDELIEKLKSKTSVLDFVPGSVTSKNGNYQRNQDATKINKIVEDSQRRVVTSIQAVRCPFFLAKYIPPNRIPPMLWEINKNEDETELIRIYPGVIGKLRLQNYVEKFQVALWFEEMSHEILRKDFDLRDIVLERTREDFKFDLPYIKNFNPALLIGDPVEIFDEVMHKRDKDFGFITRIMETTVFIKMSEKFRLKYTGTHVTVHFGTGRTTFMRSQFAISQAVRYLGEQWLFPTETIELKPPRIPFVEIETGTENEHSIYDSLEPPTSMQCGSTSERQTRQQLGTRDINRRLNARYQFISDTRAPKFTSTLNLVWFNTRLNDEQKDAVRRILRGQCRPLPYIIFGPPGTGKTVTVVEAVLQVYSLDSNARILVVTPSNAAADLITQRLISSKLFSIGDFARLVGFLRQECQIPEDIIDWCCDGESLDTIARSRLIICTCTTAGQFYSLGLDTGHFTHVFIDEAGYCTEPEAIISATLVTLDKSGQVILAGDPKQLGPVLMSDTANNIGLNISLLERLMSLALYSRCEENFPQTKYNPMVLTKLVKNYRSHPTLLKLPSKLFYDDELVCQVDETEIDLCTKLDFLKTQKGAFVPLRFHGIQGTCQQEPDSPSWFNLAEVIEVVSYAQKLRIAGLGNDDIGIITPYRKQVDKIRIALSLGLLSEEIPKVGSVEEFQGSERRVIIMSLVRSNVSESQLDQKLIDRMSFVFSSKRFNVGITRAKGVLIVVGNPHVFKYDSNWSTFLRYSIELEAYTGCNLPKELIDSKSLERMINGNGKENQKFRDDGPDSNFSGPILVKARSQLEA